jgi:D-glucuronyl C5-epimerase C-terminus
MCSATASSSVWAGQRAADLAARFFGRWRQDDLTRGDPLSFDPCVDHHDKKLGFYHLYHRDSDHHTMAWLLSPAYAQEAKKRHPIDACHVAIAWFHAWLKGDQEARGKFTLAVRSILDSGIASSLGGRDCFVIPHFDQIEGYRAHHKPWASSMVQGWAASLFVRAYQLDGDERYLTAARQTCGPFFVPVAQGGLLDHLPHGVPFYEKYPFRGEVRHVLNGYMSSLFGLYDLARATGDAEATQLFANGIATLGDERTLRAFDNGYTTLYDLGSGRRATPAGVFYTWVHARQLAGLGRITGAPRLQEWAERWRAYRTHAAYRLRSRADCLWFRAVRLPTYLQRTLRAPS